MGSRMAKPALDAGIVTPDAEPVLGFYEEVAGMRRLDPLTLPGIGTIHKLACGESVLRVMVPEKPPEPDDALPDSPLERFGASSNSTSAEVPAVFLVENSGSFSVAARTSAFVSWFLASISLTASYLTRSTVAVVRSTGVPPVS